MFTVELRDHVRQHVLTLAETDPRITGGALTGSTAFGAGDEWSDIDISFGVAAGFVPETVLDDWMQALDQEFGVIDYFDLPSSSSIYRVFLLRSGLEVDVAITPAEDFGARGPNFRLLFGTSQQPVTIEPPDASYLIGLCWHHILHARVAIERGKLWQAEYWNSEALDHVLALACLRLGANTFHRRGVDRLPADLTSPLEGSLVHSLNAPELRRALAVVTTCLLEELERWDQQLCARLTPVLQAYGANS